MIQKQNKNEDKTRKKMIKEREAEKLIRNKFYNSKCQLIYKLTLDKRFIKSPYFILQKSDAKIKKLTSYFFHFRLAKYLSAAALVSSETYQADKPFVEEFSI